MDRVRVLPRLLATRAGCNKGWRSLDNQRVSPGPRARGILGTRYRLPRRRSLLAQSPWVPSLRDIVERHQRTFNARDVDGWASDFAADAVMVVDGIAFRGRDAIRAYATGVLETMPGIRIELESVVAECGETFVAESRLISTDEHAAWTGWRLEGSVCELFRIVDGEIASCRTFFAYGEREAAAVADTPPRADAARVAGSSRGCGAWRRWSPAASRASCCSRR